MEKTKELLKKINNRLFTKKLYVFVYLPAIIMFMIENFYKVCNERYSTYIYIPAHILEALIIYMLILLIMSITKSSRIAGITVTILAMMLMIVNQVKIVYSDNPIKFSDIMFVASPDTFTDIMDGTLGSVLKAIWKNILVLFLIGGINIFLSIKTKIIIESIKKRITIIVSIVVTSLILFLPIHSINNVIQNIFFMTYDRSENYPTNSIVYDFKFGFLSGMCGQVLENYLVEPEDYDCDELNKLLDDVQLEQQGGWGRPNIIMIFSESFWDISQIDEIEFDKPITANFNRLKEDGLFFNMISPTFGGLSSNPEVEMLTSCGVRFFNDGYIPYMQLMTDDRYRNMPSIVHELNNNDYYTKIVSTWGKALFNSVNVYDYMGVDEVMFKEDLKDNVKKGGRISEEYVADKIIEEMENKPVDEQLFYMVLTAQSHMPYNYDRYNSYDIAVKDSTLPKNMQDTLLTYAQGLYDADLQLGRIYEYINTLDEDTIIIFYGDHLPYLKTEEQEDIYKKLAHFNTEDELLNTFRKYNTQCLVAANFDIKASIKDEIPSYLGPDMVMPYLLNHMDIELSIYYKWLYSVHNDMPASNRFVTVDKDGNMYNTNALPDEIQEAYDLREKMNWKFFIEDFYED